LRFYNVQYRVGQN